MQLGYVQRSWEQGPGSLGHHGSINRRLAEGALDQRMGVQLLCVDVISGLVAYDEMQRKSRLRGSESDGGWMR